MSHTYTAAANTLLMSVNLFSDFFLYMFPLKKRTCLVLGPERVYKPGVARMTMVYELFTDSGGSD